MPEVVDFNYHIKPILSDRCFKCHGPDANTREANLRLDTPEGAFARLEEDTSKFSIVAGNAEESEVYRRIVHPDPEERMPHPDSKLFLSEQEKELVKRWIDQGAEWKEHWAFSPPQNKALPTVQHTSWPRRDLDYFVLARLENEGLTPSKEESKEKWLRRVYFDITGLPPASEDIDAFIGDSSPDAYEKVVDHLLASPGYGEHMAAKWLDMARYADSHGYQDDRPRTIWPWRDWVIKAYNENIPYDQFVTWQLAGDLLPEASYEQKLATAFNRNHAITQEGGVINEEYVTEYVADRTNTMSTAVLGLTMECARCHDHKYDPISQKEYFELFAFFNGIDERGQINYFDLAPAPNMRVQDEKLEARIADVEQKTLAAEQAYASLMQLGPEFETWYQETFPSINMEEVVAQELVAHFKLDELEQAATPNEAIAGREGKINTRLLNELAAPALIEGHNGKAFKFDGENYLNIGDQADFNHSDRFSLGGWMIHAGGNEKEASLIVKRNEEQKRGGYQMMLTSEQKLLVSLIHHQSNERVDVQTRQAIPSEAWTHVFATYDGSGEAAGLTLFVDGVREEVEVVRDSLGSRSILNGNDVLLGNWTTRNTPNGRLGGFADGALDDVRIYSRQLSDVEVHYLAGGDEQRVPDADDASLLFLNRYHHPFIKARNRLDSLRSIQLEVPMIMVMEEMEEPRATHVLARGAYDAPQERVYPNTPTAILDFPADYPQNRLGLAQWLFHEDHPLTSRVAVNRLWHMFFGQGIVKTPEDFGSQGALPSHPDLLDWMAIAFRESGWDTKAMIKDIALSSTYRQRSQITPDLYQRDPGNELLARGPAQRFTAEMMRDNALQISGLLNPAVGGPWVKPYQPPGVWKELANQIGENKYRPSEGPDLYRRSVYSYWKRTIPPPFMLTFDAAERTVCVVKRQTTSTPLQALVLLNDPQLIEASRKLAERMIEQGGENIRSRLAYGFLLATTREPDRSELRTLTSLFEEEHSRFSNDENEAKALLNVGTSPINPALDTTDLAALTVVANTLINLDEARIR